MEEKIRRTCQLIQCVRADRAHENRVHKEEMLELKAKIAVLKEKLHSSAYSHLNEEKIHEKLFGEYLKRNQRVVPCAILRFAADNKQLDMLKNHCTERIQQMHKQITTLENEALTVQRGLEEKVQQGSENLKSMKRDQHSTIRKYEHEIRRLRVQHASQNLEYSFNKSLSKMWARCFNKGEGDLVPVQVHDVAKSLHESFSTLELELDPLFEPSF